MKIIMVTLATVLVISSGLSTGASAAVRERSAGAMSGPSSPEMFLPNGAPPSRTTPGYTTGMGPSATVNDPNVYRDGHPLGDVPMSPNAHGG
jgi:hypothetical protein